MSYNKNDFVQKVCDQIGFKAAHKCILEELEAHIDEHIEQYIDQGLDEKAASIEAVRCMGDPIEIGTELNKIHKPQTEWGVITAVILLSILGIGTVFFIEDLPFGSMNTFGIRQIVYVLFGLLLLAGAYLFDYTRIYKHSTLIFSFGIVLTIITLLFGTLEKGLLYIKIGSITFKTGSLCNLMFMIAIIAELSKCKDKGIIGFLKIGLLSTISIAALVLNPCVSLIFIMIIVYAMILTIAVIKNHFDYKGRWIYLSIMYGVIFSSLLVVRPHMVFVNNAKQVMGYLVNSQWIGKSAFLNKYGWRYLPENWADYFFTIVIANFGWLAGSIAISLFVILLGTMILRSLKLKNNFGFYMAIGASVYLLINFIMNILVSMGFVEGFICNLPFISFGGTDYVNNSLVVGLFLSVWRRRLVVPSDMNSNLDFHN